MFCRIIRPKLSTAAGSITIGRTTVASPGPKPSERVAANNGRRKKATIVALVRKLLVALWKYVTFGVVIEGAVMKQA